MSDKWRRPAGKMNTPALRSERAYTGEMIEELHELLLSPFWTIEKECDAIRSHGYQVNLKS